MVRSLRLALTDIPRLIALRTRVFLALVLVAFVIAGATTRRMMQNWLGPVHPDRPEGRRHCCAELLRRIAALTVEWQSVRAALQNPAQSLRTE